VSKRKGSIFLYAAITVALTILNIPLIFYLFRFMESAAFSLTCLPPIFAGWFLGIRSGAISGIVMGVIGFIEMLFLGIPLVNSAITASLGTFLVTMVGVGFGYLHALADTLNSKVKDEKKGRINAEEAQLRLEERLQQTHKMEAIGTLAGGVAHDINNVLGVILASASVIETEVGEDNLSAECVKDIITACRQGRDLTRNLLAFARKGKYVTKIIDIENVINNTKNLLEHTIQKKITIETHVSQDSLIIEGDRSQIDQAMMNVCINGIEAMNGSGKLTIDADSISIDDSNYLEYEDMKPGSYVRIVVTDTGTGMDKQTLKRAFEPFFTTKDSGQGTGLGLSMVYGSISNHGGDVSIKSEPGSGTRITMLIPSSDTDLVPATAPPLSVIKKGKGRILLVDDEALFRNSCAQLLKKLGYEVLIAKSGIEAVDLYRNSEEPVCLTILDLIMPDMDGVETFYKLKELDSNIKVLIASGYCNDKNIDRLLSSGAVGFVEKPFDLTQISTTIYKALERRTG